MSHRRRVQRLSHLNVASSTHRADGPVKFKASGIPFKAAIGKQDSGLAFLGSDKLFVLDFMYFEREDPTPMCEKSLM